MCDNNISNESYCSVGGGGGTDLTWIDPYLIEQPPTIVYETITYDTGQATVYIPWVYPPQINVGFMSNDLPLIVSFSSNLVTTAGTFPIVTSQSSEFINDSYTGITNAVTGIALTSDPIIITGSTYQYNGRNYYYFNYLTAGINLTTPGNSIISWYQNYSNLVPNMSTSGLFNTTANPFLLLPTITLVTSPSDSSELVITYTGASGATNYQIEYSNNYPLSTVRYNSVPLSANTATAIVSTVAPYNTVPLYPETSYTVNVSARDSTHSWGNPATYSPSVTDTSLSNIVGLSSSSIISFPTLNSTLAKKITDNSTVFITTSTSEQKSNFFLLPINTKNTRGTLGTGIPLMTLEANGGTPISYNGFPATLPAPASQTSGNITLTSVGIPTDNYIKPEEQGFYLNANVFLTLSTAFFTGSPTLTLTQSFPGSGILDQSTSFTFTTPDSTTTVPVSTYPDIKASGTYSQVSGIYCIVQDPVSFKYSSCVSPMGTLYYIDPLATYSITIGNDPVNYTYQTVLKNGIPAGDFPSITITSSPSIITSNANSSGTTIIVRPKYYNIIGSTTGTQLSLSTYIDYASNINININTIRDVSLNNPIIGCRVYSGPGEYLISGLNPQYPNLTVPTYLFTSTPNQQYANIIYQNSWKITDSSVSYQIPNLLPISFINIDARTELLMIDGQYTTYRSKYIDYSPYYYYNGISTPNTANYSTILHGLTDYRYATFAWNIPIDGTTQGYNFLTFNINGINTTEVVDPEVPITIGPLASLLRFYYRFEQLDVPLPQNPQPTLPAINYSSIWSDANSLISSSMTNVAATGIAFSNGNYYGTFNNNNNPNEIYFGYLAQHVPTFFPTFITVPEPNTTLTFQVSCPNLAPSRSSNIYLYCRIGLPMHYDFSFSNVTATFTVNN